MDDTGVAETPDGGVMGGVGPNVLLLARFEMSEQATELQARAR